MDSLRQELVDAITEPEQAFDQDPEALLPRQLQVANDLFQQRRHQIPLIERRAGEAGVDVIRRFDDLVPLLFAHTVYKSYPNAFVERGRWDRMLQWLDTLSVPDVTGVNVDGVRNIDEWIERLWDAGHRVLATSGSSGKCSFLNHTLGDGEYKRRHFKYHTCWPYAIADNSRTVFWLGPINGPNSANEAGQFLFQNWGKPGGTFALTDEPLRISEVSRMAAMRKKMAEGSATPREIADFEAESRARGAQGAEAMIEIADKILDRRHEPIMISGLWAQHMVLVNRARERGIPDGDFNPESIIQAGGGIKGVALPDDYQEQVSRLYGSVIRPATYGMTELASAMPRCEAGRYHRAPSLIWLILDRDGERLLTEADARDGIVEGRFGFLDLIYEGRWGGLITGDKVTVDFNRRCPCGRHGPTLLDNITRFAQVGQDDHIGCAGTIDGYIRGALGE